MNFILNRENEKKNDLKTFSPYSPMSQTSIKSLLLLINQWILISNLFVNFFTTLITKKVQRTCYTNLLI